MGAQSISLLTQTLLATGAIIKHRFVTFAGAQAGLKGLALGVSEEAAATDETVPVAVNGTAVIDSGGAFAVGAALESDAQGRAVAHTDGVINARALEAATGADEKIEVLLINS